MKTTSSKKVSDFQSKVTQGKHAVRHPENIADEDNTREEPRRGSAVRNTV